MPSSPRVLVLGAMESALAPLRPRLRGLPVAVARTGISAERAAACAVDAVLRERPEFVLLLGFAGGLDPALNAGDVVAVDRVCSEDGDPITLARLSSPERRGARGLAGVTLLSVDRVVRTPREKTHLLVTHEAAVVDRESGAVAAAVAPLGIEFGVLHGVTHTADSEPPADACGWFTDDGATRRGAVVRWALCHPHRIAEFTNIARVTRRAADRLAEHAERIIHERLQ